MRATWRWVFETLFPATVAESELYKGNDLRMNLPPHPHPALASSSECHDLGCSLVAGIAGLQMLGIHLEPNEGKDSALLQEPQVSKSVS